MPKGKEAAHPAPRKPPLPHHGGHGKNAPHKLHRQRLKHIQLMVYKVTLLPGNQD
jgi:hypothetical protein